MKKKKINIDSTEPINSIAEVDMVVDAFVKRGGYITIEEDLKIRKRISNGNHLASWINYVKNKLIYRKEKIVKHISGARASIKKRVAPMYTSSPIAKPVKEEQEANVVLKRSLTIDSYSDICKEDPELRPYQQKAKKEIFESWDEVDNVMFQMPTGTGKTRLFTSIISDINKYSIQRREPVKILIIAHRTELITQIGESLDKYHVGHNFMAGGMKREHKYPVYVASIQTIAHNINEALKLNVQFVIIDEAHHALAKTYKKLWEMYPNAKRLGVTATPWRMNHQSFTDLFDKLVMSMPIKDFIKQGHLAPYKYYSLKDDSDIQKTIDGIELDDFGEYKESSMEEKMDIGHIRAQLLDSYLSLAGGKKGIIYAINRKHAKHICEEYQKAGYKAVSIDAKTPDAERKDLVKKFKKGEIDIIVNVDIFSEGFDCPDIEFIQLARPTRSLVKYLQQVGRGLRITENKRHCVILDNVGMYSRFGLPDARRHWKYHFLGQDVDEEPKRLLQGAGGGGGQRFVDLSEGIEDMELIQDDYEDVEPMISSSSAIDDFFPLFGVTLGKTTWKDAEDMGCKVEIHEKGPARNTNVNNVYFWDHEGKGVFTSLYWTKHHNDFSSSWKSKGFSWDNSYDEWTDAFEKLGYSITIIDEPCQKLWQGRTVFSAEFKAVSPDRTLLFNMDFDFGKNGYFTSSPKTLYSISVDYKGELAEETVDIVVPDEDEYDESLNGSRCLIFDETGKEVIGCEDDDCENIFIPEGVTAIAKDAFENNKQIKTVSFPESLISIGSSAFRGCSGITQIELNENLEKIGFDAFYGTGLKEVEIPYLVKDIGASAFNCEMKVDPMNTDLYDLDGVLYDYYETKLFIYPSLKRDKHYDVEDGIQEIEYFAFEDSCLQSISLPDTIEILGTNIFNGCNNLTKLIIHVEDPNEIEVHKECFVGFNKKQCRLIVPEGCKDKYSSHEMFKDFLSIEEIKSEEDEERIPQKEQSQAIDESEIEQVYVGIPSADPYTEIEYENETEEEVKEPRVPIDPMKLEKIFEKKATSYKYFWFMAIISLAKEKKSLTISYKDIVVRMASLAWPIVFDYKIDLGNNDMIANYLNDIIKSTNLPQAVSSKVVEAYLSVYYESDGIGKILGPLLKNVPYRFLSPWIPYTNDEEVIEKSNSGDYACLYALCDDHIVLNEEWWDYIKKRILILSDFTKRSFASYLQTKNGQWKIKKFMSAGWSLA